jgi:hypothetical protein
MGILGCSCRRSPRLVRVAAAQLNVSILHWQRTDNLRDSRFDDAPITDGK